MAIIFEIIISGIVLLYLDIRMGLIIVVACILLTTYSYKLQKKQRALKVIANNVEDEEKAFTSDTLTNIDSVKYYGKEDVIKDKYCTLTEKTKNAWFKEWQLGRWTGSIESLIMNLGGLSIIILSLKLFLNGEITLGTLTFAWSSYWAIIINMQSFMDGLRGYNKSIADFSDLFQYGKIQNDIKDKENAKNLVIKEGLIEFKDVNFQYHAGDLFKNFNLVVNTSKTTLQTIRLR
jgi:ATP-binding cassette subfamily B protein